MLSKATHLAPCFGSGVKFASVVAKRISTLTLKKVHKNMTLHLLYN